MGKIVSALAAAAFGLALTSTQPLVAQDSPTAPPPAEPTAETLGYVPDNTLRMTVPVSIGGQGPYRFIVDTGAERTVIAKELARDLDLDAGQTATVHSMTEVSRIATVVLPGLRVGSRTVNGIHAPALSQSHLGAAGMLGVDSLRSQRVVFDFKRQELTVSPSSRRQERWPSGDIVVVGRRLFGHLVLIDAAVDGVKVWVIIDTGSQVTVGNSALRTVLERRGRLGPTGRIGLTSITGGTMEADYGVAQQVRIGEIDIRNLPVAFADVHPFRKLKLTDRPALLLGMDALTLFDRVSVDFANRRVRVLLDDSSRLDAGTRLAARARRQAPL
jgi:predicted aspartyl protease